MRKILVTGGEGYIGAFTVPFLREKGYKVINYDIKINPRDDVFDSDRLEKKMSGCNIVYHLAAVPHPFEGNEPDYRIMNWEVPIKVFQAAAKSGVKKFIFASSGCAYGVWGGFCSPARFPIMESDPTPNIEDGQTLYGYYKVLFEKYMQKHAAALGMKCVALRLEGVNTNVVGPYPAYLGKFMAGHRPQEQSCKLWHFLGNCSPENYQQMLGLVIERDLDSLFEVFNVENGILHPANDPHDIIARFWPEAKDEVVGHGSLISIEKAKKLLGYNPAVPQAFSEWTENDGIQKIPSNAKLPKHPNAQQLHKTQKFSMKELVKQVLDISPLRLLRFIKRACGV